MKILARTAFAMDKVESLSTYRSWKPENTATRGIRQNTRPFHVGRIRALRALAFSEFLHTLHPLIITDNNTKTKVITISPDKLKKIKLFSS